MERRPAGSKGLTASYSAGPDGSRQSIHLAGRSPWASLPLALGTDMKLIDGPHRKTRQIAMSRYNLRRPT
jgi:hypothetical protein